ncbi:MAG: 3-oxoacyl-ACP reductase FabG [Clostridiales bacterium]|nr:3-oxoacyl-ACP reductase FabG [Clostridiales bacterium]
MSGTVLVTGASRGIGKSTALLLSQSGYSVAVNYLNSADAANDIAEYINSHGGRAGAFKADVSEPDEVERMFSEIRLSLGEVTALVNNAGIAEQRVFSDISSSQWERMLAVHLTGAFNCSKEALKDMIRRKSGSIVNISSMWGQTGGSCEVHYSAAKAGIIGLTKALAKEVAPSSITVNCVAPGIIATDMMSGFSSEDKENMCADIPLGRLGTPDEVAHAVKFLLSESARYITGQVLAVNGGLVI